MGLLPLFVAAGRPVVLLGDGEAAAAKRRLLERAGACIVGEEAAASIAVVALEGDPAEAAAARLRARGMLLNVVDRPDLCDWFFPALVERAPVLVAIGTGGVSAGLAAALRQRLEALLPAGLGRVADALGAARGALAAALPEAGARRRFLGALLAPGGALDPLVEHRDPAAVIAHAGLQNMDGRVERVVIRSADPDELTLRAARLLGQADRVHHPADMAPAILGRARADAVRIAGPAPAPPGAGLTVELSWA